MKKGIFLLASISIMMLAGCGESSSGASVSSGGTTTGGTSSTPSSNVTVDKKVDAETASLTTPSNLYNISDTLGSPPALQ